MIIRKAYDILHFCKDIVYPLTCCSCNSVLETEGIFCINCRQYSTETDHFELSKNTLTQRVKYRIEFKFGAALYYFNKGAATQSAIHKLKYSGRKDIAERMGRRFAKKLINSQHFCQPDTILPIPIHAKRLRKRGYNQSQVFGKAIGAEINCPCIENVLIKTRHHKSLTEHDRENRFLTVMKSFMLKDRHIINSKNILLVDDVITTGATIEAASTLLNSAGVKSLQIGLIGISLNE